MIVGIMILDLLSENSHSLKEKRQLVMSIKERLRHRFNISLIESDHQDLWQKFQISIAMVANSKKITEKVFNQIEDIIFAQYPVKIIQINKEYL